MMPTLCIRCFGSLQITVDGGNAINFDTDKTRALLVYLAMESGQPQRREYLAGLLWSDQPETRALHNLRQTLTYLRKALGEAGFAGEHSGLEVTRESVQLSPQTIIWVDAQVFANGLAEAQKHYQRRNGRGRLNLRQLRRAVALYTGQFLDHFQLSGSPLFDEWAALKREDYNHQAVEALAMLGEYYERRQELSLARQAAARQVQLAPWEESAQAQLMYLLALDGQWSAAQNQYARLKRTLRDELDVEPAEATTRLFQQIRQAAAAKRSLAPRLKPAISQLPGMPGSFIGREAELDRIAELLCDPDIRLVTLLGAGGSGKTRLALEAAHEQVGIFPDGVFFCNLAAIRSGAQLVQAVADGVGYELRAADNQADELKQYLSGKNLLLVLDNFEQLLEDELSTGWLAQVLAAAPDVVLLVSSRQRLGLVEEHILAIEGLRYPEAVQTTREAQQFEALILFESRARQLQSAFQLSEASLPDAVQICRILEGLPLGVELAAAATWQRSLAEIAGALAENINTLHGLANNLTPRHRSLYAAFEVSWQLLADREQQTFARLAVFRGGFEQAAALPVAQCTPDILTRLVDQSMLRRMQTGRFDLHEGLRQFAFEKLNTEYTDYDCTLVRFAGYYADWLAALNRDLKGAGQLAALDAVHREFDNLRQAWGWLVAQQAAGELARSADSLYHFLNIRSRYAEGIELFQQAAAALEGVPGAEVAQAVCLTRLGMLAYRAYNRTLAEQVLVRSQEVLSGADAPGELATCQAALSGVRMRQRKFELAWELAHASLQIFLKEKDDWGEAYAVYQLGLIENKSANYAASRQHMLQAVAASQRCGDQRRMAAPLNMLGDLACIDGDYTAAEGYFQRSLEITARLNDRFNQAILLNNLATVYRQRKDFQSEQHTLLDSLAICREIGDRDGEAFALTNLGELSAVQGDFNQAETYSRQALEIAEELGEELTIIICLLNLGKAQAGKHGYALAKATLLRSLRLAREIEAWNEVIRLLIALARVYTEQGKPGEAVELLQTAGAHPTIESEYKAEINTLLNNLQPDLSSAAGGRSMEETLAWLLG